MSYELFDPTKANQLAKFQGQLVGLQAGNASALGVGTAATSVFNQSGKYVFQDTDTGMFQVKTLAPDSLTTNQWYDQSSGTTFDFTTNGQGIVPNENRTSSSASNNNGVTDYPFGNGYVVPGITAPSSSQTPTVQRDENGEQIQLTADDLQELVDAGIYETTYDALNATLDSGYGVSDDEQAKLGLYSKDDESKIQLMMEKYGLSRKDAIGSLGNSITDPSPVNQLVNEFKEIEDNQGFFGNLWNGIKEFTGIGTSKSDAAHAIEQYNNGEISFDEAKEVLDKYGNKQTKGAEILKTGGAVAAGAAAGLAIGGPVGLLVGAAAGAGAKLIGGLIDRGTNNVEGDAFDGKEIAKDVATGAIAGATAGAAAKVGGTVLKAAGKIVSKGFHAVGKFITGIFTK